MVTGGATPLEGLPGINDRGELDAGVVLALAKGGMGPEEIDRLLTTRSGLSALAERAIDFDDLTLANNEVERLARDVFVYRLVLACGAGISAIGGLDAIVFSGRFAEAGKRLSSALVPPLALALRREPDSIAVEVMRRSLESLVAEMALDYAMVRRSRGAASAVIPAATHCRRATGSAPAP